MNIYPTNYPQIGRASDSETPLDYLLLWVFPTLMFADTQKKALTSSSLPYIKDYFAQIVHRPITFSGRNLIPGQAFAFHRPCRGFRCSRLQKGQTLIVWPYLIDV